MGAATKLYWDCNSSVGTHWRVRAHQLICHATSVFATSKRLDAALSFHTCFNSRNTVMVCRWNAILGNEILYEHVCDGWKRKSARWPFRFPPAVTLPRMLVSKGDLA